jgi:hypothetical protein
MRVSCVVPMALAMHCCPTNVNLLRKLMPSGMSTDAGSSCSLVMGVQLQHRCIHFCQQRVVGAPKEVCRAPQPRRGRQVDGQHHRRWALVTAGGCCTCRLAGVTTAKHSSLPAAAAHADLLASRQQVSVLNR